ncbi:MAG: hypothetical protein HOV87_31340 [Catenulispora sp.]|nr:hypothetical protein [Catenulispora sp.]
MTSKSENSGAVRRSVAGAARTRTVALGRRRVRIRKSSGRRLHDLPELDLRTPSGRLLPY